MTDGYKPERFDYESKETEKRTKNDDNYTIERRRKISFDTEDIIAVVAGLVAILFAIGMIIGKLPVNQLTVSVAGFSAAGVVIARIVKGRRNISSVKNRK